MDRETRGAWLRIARIAPLLGAPVARQLAAPDLDPRHWLDHLPATLPPAARNALARPEPDTLARDLAWLETPGHHLLTPADATYPPLLRESPHPPPTLFVAGDPALPALPQLAVVGSRNPTSGGTALARAFAAELTRHGLVISSGLALGIDGAAHVGALDAGGLSLAVLGAGPDRIYPRRHQQLAHRMVAEGGALVSEFPPGTPPLARHFPRRNRIIAALAVGTLVVEAALRSGSLITARLATEQGREVFAIPGSIHNPLTRGCHALIRDGAKLVETAADILEELAPLLGAACPRPASDRPPEPNASPVDANADPVLHALGFDPVSIDTLVTRTGLSAAKIGARLMALELEGRVESQHGGMFTRLR